MNLPAPPGSCRKPHKTRDSGEVTFWECTRIEGELLDESFSDKQLVLIDGQGVGHDLNAVETTHFDYFDFSDYILLVEEHATAFQITKGSVKDIFSKGYDNRIKIIFNKLDMDNFPQDREDIEKTISNLEGGWRDNTGIIIDRENCFYLADLKTPHTQGELKKLLNSFSIDINNSYVDLRCNCDIDEAFSKDLLDTFVKEWKKNLNECQWKRAQAFNRRMANFEDQYDDLTPISNLCNIMFDRVDFQKIVNPAKEITSTLKEFRIKQLKQSFFQHVLMYSRWLILKKHHNDWQQALQISGPGSKLRREKAIGKIFQSVAKLINSQEFRDRAKNSLHTICAEDPRIKTRLKNGIQIRVSQYKIIKHADVKLAGLTILAGENDTGKSTISKIFFSEIRKLVLYRNSLAYPDSDFYPNMPIFIDTPDVLDKFSYIKNTSLLLQQNKLHYDLPQYVTDLILRLSQSAVEDESELFYQIKQIIKGEIRYSKAKDNIIYKKYSLPDTISMPDTSMGLKMFGVLQMLIQNQTLTSGSILILDEPEIHIHPNWQLKYAEIIIGLVKHGVKVLLSSHSPYMIEALVRYGRREEVGHMELYLAEKQNNQSLIQCVTSDISKIFDKLSEPFDIFNTLDLEEIEHG